MKAVLVNDTRNEKHLGCVASVLGLIKLCKNVGIEIIRTYTRKEVSKIDTEGVELVVVNGEGSLHRSPSFFKDILKFLDMNDLYAVVLNTVWEKMFFKYKLNRVKLIAFREPLSLESFKQTYPNFEGGKFLAVDTAFVWANIEVPEIGYGDSVMDMLRFSLAEGKNFYPLSPMVMPDFVSYISWLKGLKLYVTGRFHGVVFATIAGTPFLAFPSNSHKIEGLLKDMGCEDLLIKSFKEIQEKSDLAKKSKDRIIQFRDTAKKRLDDLKGVLKEVIDEIQNKKG